MPRCPQCTKPLAELEPQCPHCKADLDLLVAYVRQLEMGLARAERLTRDGKLAEAVWAYLAVLEVDPDNVAAQAQVGAVATAVRQFDRTAPARRWLAGARGEVERGAPGQIARWLRYALIALLVACAFLLGSTWAGRPSGSNGSERARPAENTLGPGPAR